MKITVTNGRYTEQAWLPSDEFYIRDVLDKLRADGETLLKIKISDSHEVPALEGAELTADLYKMNFFVRHFEQKLDNLCDDKLGVWIAALLKVKPERTIDELIRMTYSDCIPVYHCKDYAELGEMVILNNMMSELEDVPDKLLPMIDRAWVGRTFAERQGGIFVDGYYCITNSYTEPPINVSVPKREGNYFSLIAAPPNKSSEQTGRHFDLPTDIEEIDKYAFENNCNTEELEIYELHSSIPVIYENNTPDDISRLALYLAFTPEDDIVKLKAVLQTLPAQNFKQALEIVHHIEEYELDRSVRSYDEFGQKYLQKLLPPEFSAKALDDTDLTDLGCNILFMKGGTITTYGALSGKGQQLYTPIVDEVIEETEDESEDENMGVMMT